MTSINFFIPVIYSNHNKTISQQALEIIDEYFYLGGKFRVTIFAPDAEHPQSWALKSRKDRHRSWINIAIKVASYCTIVLPLIALTAKAALRHYLKVSSIKVHQQFVPSSRMESRLPTVILQKIGSFLSHQDQAQLAQVGIFTSDSVHKTQQYYMDSLAPLKKVIEAFPSETSVYQADAQQLLIQLITSPAVGHPKHWVPVMDALMRHIATDKKIEDIIQKHAIIADLLATSTQLISPDQIYQFCRYLGKKQLSKLRPWICYRALEQYSRKQRLNAASVNKALKEYLFEQAKMHIRASSNDYSLDSNRRFIYRQSIIDPRDWYGLNRVNSSLWVQPHAQNGEIAPMPELLLEVLWAHIQSLRARYPDRPFMVKMNCRAEAEIPYNFTLPLAQHITNAEIFLYHDDTVNLEQIGKPYYARSLEKLSKKEAEVLVRDRYPNALTTQD